MLEKKKNIADATRIKTQHKERHSSFIVFAVSSFLAVCVAIFPSSLGGVLRNTVMTILVIVASIAFISSLWTGGDQNLSMFTPTQLKLLGIDKNGVMAPESTRKIPQTIVENTDNKSKQTVFTPSKLLTTTIIESAGTPKNLDSIEQLNFLGCNNKLIYSPDRCIAPPPPLLLQRSSTGSDVNTFQLGSPVPSRSQYNSMDGSNLKIDGKSSNYNFFNNSTGSPYNTPNTFNAPTGGSSGFFYNPSPLDQSRARPMHQESYPSFASPTSSSSSSVSLTSNIRYQCLDSLQYMDAYGSTSVSHDNLQVYVDNVRKLLGSHLKESLRKFHTVVSDILKFLQSTQAIVLSADLEYLSHLLKFQKFSMEEQNKESRIAASRTVASSVHQPLGAGLTSSTASPYPSTLASNAVSSSSFVTPGMQESANQNISSHVLKMSIVDVMRNCRQLAETLLARYDKRGNQLIELICEYQNLVALCISPLDILPLESASGSTPSSASSGGGSTFFAYISDLNHQKKISLVLNRLDTLSMDGHLGRVIWNPSHTTQKTYDYSTTTSYIRRMLSPSKSFVSTTPTKDDQRSNTEHLKVSDAELVMWIFLHYCESHIVRSGRELMGVSSYTPVFSNAHFVKSASSNVPNMAAEDEAFPRNSGPASAAIFLSNMPGSGETYGVGAESSTSLTTTSIQSLITHSHRDIYIQLNKVYPTTHFNIVVNSTFTVGDASNKSSPYNMRYQKNQSGHKSMGNITCKEIRVTEGRQNCFMTIVLFIMIAYKEYVSKGSDSKPSTSSADLDHVRSPSGAVIIGQNVVKALYEEIILGE